MEELKKFLNSKGKAEQDDFARRCQTTLGYLRTAIYTPKRIGARLAVAIERESGGAVRVEQIDETVDWAFLRGTR